MAGHSRNRWSVSLGRWWGVSVRLHILLLLFMVLTLALTFNDQMPEVGLMTLGVLLVSLGLHELAHTIAALRLGGIVDQVVLGPAGGLASPRVPDEPEPQVFVAMAGPLVHLALAVAAAGLLAYWNEPDILGLLNPVLPANLDVGPMSHILAKLTLWLNWTLLVLNLLPVYPFDGGPALRAMLWPLVGRQSAWVITARTAIAIALGLVVIAFFVDKNDLQARMPLWAPLVTLAIFLFISASHDLALARRLEGLSDFPLYSSSSDGKDLLDSGWPLDDADDMVLVEQRTELQLERREQQRKAVEANEDARVDDILARLHASGMEHLSPEDRAILERASERYRTKHRS
jgi:Zn-dependent protease